MTILRDDGMHLPLVEEEWFDPLLKIVRSLPPVERLPVGLGRALFHTGSRLAAARNLPKVLTARASVETPAGRLCLKTWESPGRDPGAPGLLFFHGGGWTYGSASSHGDFCAMLAAFAGVKVYAVDYRRAPEHPYPAALLDGEWAWQWLKKKIEVEDGLHSQGLLIGGDSAGGNLAAALCLKLRDRGEPLPLRQILIYPVVDLSSEWDSYTKYGQDYLLTASLMGWFIRQYHPTVRSGDALDRLQSAPYAAPLRAGDFSGLPPASIFLAGMDILLDQGQAFAGRLAAGGTHVSLEIFPDMIHGFLSLLAFRPAWDAAYAIAQAIAQAIAGAHGVGERR